MSALNQILKTHRFATLAFGVALLGILAGVGFGLPGKAKRQEPVGPKITSRTSAVRVVSTETTSLGTANALVVKLQNTTNRDIKAYTLTSGKASATSSYFLRETSFAAGSTIEKILPLSSGSDYAVPLSEKEIKVAAVFFADGTGDGVSIYVSSLADQYAGTRDQAKRILPCLLKLSLVSESVAACEAEARNLPVKMDGKSSEYEFGLEATKNDILSELNQIHESTRVNSIEAADKKERLTRVFGRLAETSKQD